MVQHYGDDPCTFTTSLSQFYEKYDDRWDTILPATHMTMRSASLMMVHQPD